MREFTFENQGTNTYLVYAVGAEESIDTMSLGMLTNNKIPGLAPAIFTQMDANKFIKYNVSSHISVKQFFSGPVNKKRLLGVFSGIVDAMLSAEDYMIDVNTILMDLDYIFADVSTCETILVCLPINGVDNAAVDLGAFFKNIMFSTQFDQTENCDHVAQIMNYLNSTPVLSLADFKDLLFKLEEGVQAAPAVAPKPQPVVPAPAQPVAAQPTAPVAAPTTQIAQPAVQVAPVAQPVQKAEPPQPAPMAVPQKAVAAQPVHPAAPQAQAAQAPTGKKMSMMDLLMHYNKENAALYKAQKEAAKQAQAAPAKAAPAPAPKANFAVPGQAAPAPAPKANFAVPGQAAPAPAPKANFAVPGQATPAVVAKPVPAQPVAAKPVVAKPVVAPQPAEVKPAVAPQPVQQAPVVPHSQPMNFGETTVLGGGSMGETTVLGVNPMAQQDNPHLVRAKNNEKINLNKPVFRIGKEKSYVDYFIGDNTAISRSHANFISRDGKFYVTDTNSTNHTYVNGAMIQSNVEVELSHGDKVRLANEDFEFKRF